MKAMRTGALPTLLLAACIVAAGILLHPSASVAGETIFYTAIRPANWDLYLFDEPEKPPRRLTTDPALDYNPTFSPDGRYVVFCSERRGNPDLFVLDLLSPGPARLFQVGPMDFGFYAIIENKGGKTARGMT